MAIAERVERRLAAVLAADVAGYSRLIGVDEEGTLARLRAHRREVIDPKIAEHRGRIVKTTGDGLLVEFSSVVDALRCATEIQAAMTERNIAVPALSRIEFRIGIHQGDIVVEDGDIFGDGVNIAARLEGLAEPGGICVSARVQEDAVGKLDLAFEHIGELELKNIARPVRVFRVAAKRVVKPSELPATLPLPDKPSVAVLPFTNMSADPEQEFFADGIAEDIITALSRYPSLFVIARNSCFAYKGRAVDVKQVGRELGVRYVLEGGLRKSANRIRVTAQLVEAETGKHVWAERYDRDLSDIFALQDEITEAVTTASAPAIAEAEQQRAMRKPPGSLDAWAAYQRGLWYYGRASAEDNALAEQFFRVAIDLDPSFAGGYRGLAWAQIRAAAVYQTRYLAEVESSAEALARRAVALDGADAEARSCLSNVLRLRGDYGGALAEAEQARAISPNLASAHGMLGAALTFSGRPKVRTRGSGDMYQTRSSVPNVGRSLKPGSDGTLLLPRIHGRGRGGETGDPVASEFFAGIPVVCRRAGPTWSDRRSEGGAGEGHRDRATSFDMYVRGRVPWMRPEDHAHMLEGLRKAGWQG